jgi:predicted aldo/keto reductase-like oxidoreductase
MKKFIINRRNFLRNTSLGLAGAGLIGKEKILMPDINGTYQDNEVPVIREYRTLGRTGFQVSDLSSGSPRNETLLRALLNAGVNFIDTGEEYENGNNERLIGSVLKDFDRKKIFINSKIYSEEKKFNGTEDVLNRVRKALERLQTDYIDCLQIHEVTKSEHLKEENYHAAMKQLKAEGRIRFTGISCHGSAHLADPEESIDKVLLSAVEDGRFDVFLMTYNFMNATQADIVLDACEKKGIGTSIMKSNPVMIFEILDGYIKKFEEKGDTVPEYYVTFHDKYLKQNEYAKDYFRKYDVRDNDELSKAAQLFVLSNPKAHTTCIDFRNITDVSWYLNLSGKKLDSLHADLLDHYRENFGYLNCRIGCNICEKACPHNIPVNTIMRYNYYYQKKGDQKHAMELYSKLNSSRLDLCQSCPGYCENTCPYGVAAKGLLAVARENLEFTSPAKDSFINYT